MSRARRFNRRRVRKDAMDRRPIGRRRGFVTQFGRQAGQFEDFNVGRGLQPPTKFDLILRTDQAAEESRGHVHENRIFTVDRHHRPRMLTGIETAKLAEWLHYRSGHAFPVRVTYHPSYLLRSTSVRDKRAVWEDMLEAMEKLGMPVSDKQRAHLATQFHRSAFFPAG